MDSISLPIELDYSQVDGRFRLVHIISQRVKELAYKGKPMVASKAHKLTTIALEEAINYKLEFITGVEAKQANEEAKKLDYKRFLEEKRRATEQEDLSELEKDLKFYLDEREEPGIKHTIDTLFTDTDTDGEPSADME